MKFLHAADVHLDAQLQGLKYPADAPVDRLRSATRQALANLVDLAIDQRVDFVLLAGDLFDRTVADMNSTACAKKQFQRLKLAGVPVHLIRGNHDSLMEGSRKLCWPDNVCEFPADRPATHRLDALQVAVHGQSFGAQAVTENLAENYPDAIPGYFNIGLLHTSLTGDTAHDNYAPTTPEVLVLKGYDYWGLGHIHTFWQVREEPAVVFPGCTQGRHINESGEKGCVIVTVRGGAVDQIDFHPLDVLRWFKVPVAVEPDDDDLRLFDRAADALQALAAQHPERLLAVRVLLQGSTRLHENLVTGDLVDRLHEHLRTQGPAGDVCWIERIDVQTTIPVDLDRLRQGQDLLGELLRDLRALQDDPDADLTELAAALAPLESKAGVELRQTGFKIDDRERLRQWLAQAEGLIVAALTRAGGTA
jgi:exonuclease SbcD